jgi:hypothetical protein
MRDLIFLLAVALVSPAAAVQGVHETDTSHYQANIDFLLDSAAADFRAHPPVAVDFRKVYFGQFDAKGQPPQYEICGEFKVVGDDGKSKWMHFTTIRTSGYEQYIGGQASSYCTREGMSWDEDDWSAQLRKRYRK